VFFAGDSAGHCLPLTAEGIRTALYFGLALGRELRGVLEGRATRDTALRSYDAFSSRHQRRFEMLLKGQWLVPRVPPRALSVVLRAVANQRITDWAFGRYLALADPSFVAAGPPPLSAPRRRTLAAA
jgi:flavin-dependent dehydrogenase